MCTISSEDVCKGEDSKARIIAKQVETKAVVGDGEKILLLT